MKGFWMLSMMRLPVPEMMGVLGLRVPGLPVLEMGVLGLGIPGLSVPEIMRVLGLRMTGC